MKKIVTIGGATQDIFISNPDMQTVSLETAHGNRPFLALPEGAKVEVQRLDYHTGGGATNSAVSFSRLDFETACCITIGDDDQGRFIIQELAAANIATYQTIETKSQTGTSFILPTPNKDRVALVWRGANTDLKAHNIPDRAFADTDSLYITSLSGDASRAFLPIAQHAKKQNKRVATNPGTSQLTTGASTLIEALPHVDILILNSWEAQLCMAALIEQKHVEKIQSHTKLSIGPELISSPCKYKDMFYDIRDFCAAMHELGPDIVVVTNGKEGVYIATESNVLFHQSLPTQIVNTLGAGDAFGSVFVATMLMYNDIKKATLCGLLNAQSVIEHLDAKTGLLRAHELENRYHSLISDSIHFQKFPLI